MIVSILTAGFAIWLPLEQLAKATSFIVLCVFTLVNLALWRLKKTRSKEFSDINSKTPSAPVFGAMLCIALLGFQIFSLF